MQDLRPVPSTLYLFNIRVKLIDSNYFQTRPFKAENENDATFTIKYQGK